jgi:tRNA pseudouridine55 synthase
LEKHIIMDGMINIYKEPGYTSHDVVARMRGILKQKKIGHTGTLDPEATGVLPVCVGAATKLCDLFTDHSKVYEAVLHLGIETDTEDMTGTVQKTDDSWKDLKAEAVLQAVQSFVGPYDQIPPMYSALKVQGRKLYEYARKGIEVQRDPRRVQIYDITQVEVQLPLVRMRVSCSKGTYIRTLCADIGKKLGCGGCMEALCRVQVGHFLLKDSITLDQLEEYVREDRLEQVLQPVDGVFAGLPAAVVTAEGEKYLMNGNPLRSDQLTVAQESSGDGVFVEGDYSNTVRVYDQAQHFIGLYDYHEDKKLYEPRKLFFVGVTGGKG